MDSLYAATKFFHVLFAALWLGGGAFNVFVVQQVLASALPATRRDLNPRLTPRMFRYINTVSLLTILTGLLLVGLHPNGFTNLTGSAWGKAIIYGFVAALLSLYLINVALRPTFKAILKITSSLPPDAEPPANLRFLLLRARATSLLNLGILASVLLAMVIANSLFFGPA